MGKPGKYGKGKQSTWWGDQREALQRLRYGAAHDLAPGVPTWDGKPDKFQTFKQAAEWYVASLKENERALAASRVWTNLRGLARLAVSRLSAKDYEGESGMDKLLEFLAKTPLAKQPLPDAYQKIDQYRNVKRNRGETAAEYVLREQLKSIRKELG